MIREATVNDMDVIMKIWLETNISVHSFVSPNYWGENFQIVKEAIKKAEVYVAESEKRVVGFIGLDDTFIAGLFVEQSWQRQGVGGRLVDYVKHLKPKLTLSVYAKNDSAVNFYKKHGFVMIDEHIDENTNEKEYSMVWGK